MSANPIPTTDSDSEITKPFEDSAKTVVNIHKRVKKVEESDISIHEKLDLLLKNDDKLRAEINKVKKEVGKSLRDVEQRLLDNSNRILTDVRILNNSVKAVKNLQYLDVPFLDGTAFQMSILHQQKALDASQNKNC